MEICNRPPKLLGPKRLSYRIGFTNWPVIAIQNETQLGIVKLGIIQQNFGLIYIYVSYKFMVSFY